MSPDYLQMPASAYYHNRSSLGWMIFILKMMMMARCFETFVGGSWNACQVSSVFSCNEMRVRPVWKLSEKGRRVWLSKKILVLECKRLTPRKSLWFLPSPQAAFIFRPPSWEESTTFRSFLTFARLFPGWQWPSINLSSRWQIWKVRTGLQTRAHFQQSNPI